MANERQKVFPYGTESETISYEEAAGYASWFRDESKNHDLIGLAKVSRNCYELVGFSESIEGDSMGCDSEYVTIEVGKRLVQEGLVDPMVTADSFEELDDPENYKRLLKEQFGV